MESNIKHNLRSHNNPRHPKLGGQNKKQETEQEGANEDEEDAACSISIDVPLITQNNAKNAASASKLAPMSFSAISPVNVQDIQQTETILQVKIG